MEAAKAAVSKFTSNHGHTTEVHETVNPAVTSQTIKPHRHEETTQAVDREVHQHHYHTTVQPLQHQERLPEKHTHNLLPTEHREFRHDNESETKQRVAAELAQFKDSRTVHETQHTQAAAPTVAGEHVHHHVHETVVPHIQKETIQPEVVHTTMPVHETHHSQAQHHGLSALPMKTLEEFKSGGGVLTGGKHHTHEEYDGAPRPYNDKLSTTFDKLGFGHNKGHQATDSGVGGVGNDNYGNTTSGIGSHNTSSGIGGRNEYDNTSSGIGGRNNYDNNTSSGIGGRDNYDNNATNYGNTSSGIGGRNDYDNTTGTTGTTGSSKPSLLDRLNPRKDTTGDGKAGINS